MIIDDDNNKNGRRVDLPAAAAFETGLGVKASSPPIGTDDDKGRGTEDKGAEQRPRRPLVKVIFTFTESSTEVGIESLLPQIPSLARHKSRIESSTVLVLVVFFFLLIAARR